MRIAIAFVLVLVCIPDAAAEEQPRDCDPNLPAVPGALPIICPPIEKAAPLRCPNGDLIMQDDDGALWRVRHEPDPSARSAWVAGLVLMIAGHVVGSGTAIALSNGHPTVLDTVPVIGALAAATHYDAPPAATSVLILSAAGHLAGALLFAAGLQSPPRTVMERISFSAAIGRDAGGITISWRH